MQQRTIIECLRRDQQRLRELGVESISLFGSAAREQMSEESDVDLAVKLSARFSQGGFDYFARMEALRGELSNLLGREVDVVEEPARQASMQSAIDRDRVVAFP